MPERATPASPLADEARDAARSRILRAARTVLARRGLAATVDDVAEAACVSRRTVFRHFATREGLFAAAVRSRVHRYAEQLPPAPQNGDLRGWLVEVLTVTHRLNARNGRVYWELAALEPEAALSPEPAGVATERRRSRRTFATAVTNRLWHSRGGTGDPPPWLVDAVAVHLSTFTTQSLAGDFGRTPEEVAEVSAHVLGACLRDALA